MIKIKTITRILLLVFIFVSCDKFIRDEEIPVLNDYENSEYKLKRDVKREEIELKKGTPVRVIVKTGDDFIKVYCYSAGEDFLKAERILILYLFKEEFSGDVLDLAVFEDKLYDIVEPGKKLNR